MKKQTKTWTTKDGRKIRICDMSDNHIKNTIALLERSAEIATSKALFEGERMLQTLNGEQAILSVENALDCLMEGGFEPSEIYPIYDNLTMEKERRATK